LALLRRYDFTLSIVWGLDAKRLLTYIVTDFERQIVESGGIPIGTELSETLDRLDALFRRYKIGAVTLESPSCLTKNKKAVEGRASVKTSEWNQKLKAVSEAFPHVKNVLSNKARLEVADSTPETYTTCAACGGDLVPEAKPPTPRKEPLLPFPVEEIYITFYQPEEWEKLRRIAPHEERDFKNYREYLRGWRALVDSFLSDGKDVVVVDTEVDELLRWCREKGVTYDDPKRSMYPAEAARQGKIIKTYYAKNYPEVTPLNEEAEEAETNVREAIRSIEPNIYSSDWYRTPVITREANYQKLRHLLIIPRLRSLAEALTPLLEDWPPNLIVDSLPFMISEKERTTLINLLSQRRRAA
jgi:hypothetical protein